MAIDANRLNEFRKQLTELQRRLSPEVVYDIARDKIIDYIVKHPGIDADEFSRLLNDAFDVGFFRYTKEYITGFDDSLKLVNELYEDLGFDITRDAKKIARLEKVSLLKLEGFKDKTKNIIRTEFKKAVRDNLSKDELSGKIALASDKAKQYASVLASTQIKGYNRLAKMEKAHIAACEWFLYSGLRRKFSRPYCIRNKGRYYNIEEIKNTTGAEVGPAFINPFETYCGGWGCVDDLEPDPGYKKK